MHESAPLPEMKIDSDNPQIARDDMQKLKDVENRVRRADVPRPIAPAPPPMRSGVPSAPVERVKPAHGDGTPGVKLSHDQRRMARRTVASARTIEAQVDAQSRMIDVMSDFGLSGSVKPSETGTMVIQLGIEPTQLRDGEIVPAPITAEDTGQACPTDLSKEELEELRNLIDTEIKNK